MLNDNVFSNQLKKLRKDRNLTQKTVALELGLGQSAVANYEKGARFPDENTLRKIALYFNISLDYLLDIKEKRKIVKSIIDLDSIMIEYKTLILSKDYKEGLEFLLSWQQRGVSLLDLFDGAIIPVLKHIGELWESSLISIAEEHIKTEEIEKTIGVLSYNAPKKNSKEIKCVCATAGIELHRIPARMISEILLQEGYQVSFLGINTPGKNVIEYCSQINADFLILSAIMDISLDAVNNIITEFKQIDNLKNCKIIVGGSAFNRNPKAWKILNADFMGRTIKETVSIINHHHQFHQ